MSDGALRLLGTLAALALPLLFAWLMVHRVVRRHRGKAAAPRGRPASLR